MENKQICVIQIGKNCPCFLIGWKKGKMSDKLFKRIVENDTPVLLALDPDAKKKTEAIKKMFLKYGIEVRQLKYEDQRDLGDMTKQEVKVLSEKAKIVNSFDSLLEAITSL